MGIPRIIRRVEAAKRDEKRGSNRVSSGIAKAPKKKRADKLRALAGAFTVEAQKDEPLGPLETKYQVHEKIGQGKQGVAVFRCTLRTTGQAFAVKRVPKGQLGHTHGNEGSVFQTLQGSSQLVAVHEILEGPHTLDYVMELATGGDLFEWVSKHGALCEERSRALFAGLLVALQQVHSRGYIHCDVKLENLLLMNPDPKTSEDVRLADFEFCTASPATGAVGSIAYAAPETLGDGQYDHKVDVWAAGVALYAMLSATAPFDSPDTPIATAHRIRNMQPGSLFGESCWAQISPAAKHLLNGLLHPDPAQRLDLVTAQMHPWLSGASEMQAAQPPKPKSPKFSLRCTWHTKMKRWSQAVNGPAADSEVRMLMDEDEDASPLLACPLEWCPSSTTRNRANSL